MNTLMPNVVNFIQNVVAELEALSVEADSDGLPETANRLDALWHEGVKILNNNVRYKSQVKSFMEDQRKRTEDFYKGIFYES